MNKSDQGLSLLDLQPQTERVPIGDSFLAVYGVSVKGVFTLFTRFPECQQWFKGGKIDVKKLVAEAPDAVAAIIAAGCGEPGNPAAEENAEKMTVEVQLDVVEAIARLTFKNGFGPFVKRIVALSEQAASVNYGRVQAMNSPPPSKPSGEPQTPKSGT